MSTNLAERQALASACDVRLGSIATIAHRRRRRGTHAVASASLELSAPRDAHRRIRNLMAVS